MSIHPDSFDAPIPDADAIGTDTAETQARKKSPKERRKTATNPNYREDFDRLLRAAALMNQPRD